MNVILLILYICLTFIYCYDNLYLSVYSITSGNSQLSLSYRDRKKRPISDYIYTGPFENIEKVLYNSRNNIEKIKNETHPWVYILNTCNFSNIRYFSNKTIFVTTDLCDNKPFYFVNYSNYTFTSVSRYKDYLDKVEKKFHYAKVGIETDLTMYMIVGITFVINMIVCIICKVITDKKIKKLFFLFYLPIYSLNSILYNILIVCNLMNVLIIPLTTPVLNIVAEYGFLFVHSVFKALAFSIIMQILEGWMILHFVKGNYKYRKCFWYFLLYEIGFSSILNLSLYLGRITSKLNLYYSKRYLELIAFISYFIYSIYKVLIPLYRQMKYEERKRSNFVECIQFKYKKMFKLFVFLGILSIIVFISPFIEHAILDLYLYDFFYHYTFLVIYEIIFCVGINFIFLSKYLPLYYFKPIIYDYKEISALIADITEDNDKNKLNISKLTSSNLKTAMKKGTPILFINPFASTKNPFLHNQLHLGIITSNK